MSKIELKSTEERQLNEIINDFYDTYLETFKTDFHFSIFANDLDEITGVEFVFRADVPRNPLVIEFDDKELNEIKEEIKAKLFARPPHLFN